MRRRAALSALLLVILAVAGCGGGGHHAKTLSQPQPPTGVAVSPPLTGALYPDPEPPVRLGSASIGPMPGIPGQNGAVAQKYLAPIYGGQLVRPAAASWNSMNLYSRRYLHQNVPSGTGDASYRTYNRQVYWKQYWCNQGLCGNAAQPGTSNHGWGRADDLASGTHLGIFDRVGPKFGWRWGEVSYESWHVTMYAGGWPHPDPGPDYNNPRLCHGSGGLGQQGFVKDVQHALSRHHLATAASGFFTIGTVGNLKRFQAAHHLVVHTCTDTHTWKELRR